MRVLPSVRSALVTLVVVGCSSGSAGGLPTSAAGFDCPTLRDKQAAAKCADFDATEYLTDCETTKSMIAPNCKSQFDAYANCVLGHPIGCTDAGKIETDFQACKAQESAATSCK